MKYNYHPVIRPLAITKAEKLTFSKSKTNFLLACLFTLLGFTDVFGQVANYTFSESAGTYSSATGTTVHASGWDDAVSANTIPLGFSFLFNGTSYTTCSIATNGFLTFGGTIAGTTVYTPISSGTGYSGAISAVGFDLISNASTITYTTTGTAPNRTFIAQWNNARRYSGGAIGGDFNFQIRLNETTNIINVVYGACTPSTTTIYSVEVGLRGASNADFNNRSLTSSVVWDSATTAGAANNSACRTRSNAYPNSGRTFTWTPPPPPIITSLGAASGCVGSSLVITGTNLTAASAVTIGGTAATITANTATSITVTVGAGTTGTVQVTNPNGSATSAATFTVNPLPAAIAGGSATVCTGASTPAFTSATTGGTWSVITGTGTASITSPGGVLTGTTAGSVTVRYTLPTGCFVTSGTITIQQTPGAIAGGSATVCNGASTPSFTNPNGGGTWSVVNGTGTATITGGGVLTGTSVGTVTVNYTIGTCTPATFNVTINPTPAAIAGGAATVCTSGTTPAFTNATGGGTWSITNGTGSATIGAATGIATGVTSGNVTVVYTVSGCSVSTTLTIITTPTITTSPTSVSVAAGSNTSFTVAASNTPTSYTWQVSTNAGGAWTTITNGGVYSNATTATLNITGVTMGMDGYQYRVSATNNCGTSTYSTVAFLNISLVYCPSVPNVNFPDGITNVQFNTINNTTATTATIPYTDYTGTQNTTVTQGQSHNISVRVNTDGAFTMAQMVWFDWNRDGDFDDAGEGYDLGTVTNNANGLSSACPFAITIPVSSAIGVTRMRVSSRFTTVSTPCANGFDGEVEDYSVTILAAPPCIEPTGQPTVLALTPGATSINGSFTAAAPVPQNYLVVMNTTNIAPTGLIIDGTTYAIGSSIGVGNTVIDTDTNTTFTASGLNTTSTYYFFIYSLNALCSGGPLYNTNATVLTGNATTVGAPAAPCIPVTNTVRNQDKYISRVAFIGTLVETNNISTFTDVTPGYQDFTILALKAQQAQGEGVNLIVESFGGRAKLYAWVDWNKNGTFENSEKVYGPPAAGISSTFGFIIPSGTVPGDYRIRVRTFNSFYNDGNGANGNPDEYFGLNFNACELFDTGMVGAFASTQYGEAEDYLFTVIQRCDANITSVVDGSVCGSGVVDLIANGTAGTTEIRWYDALTGGTYLGNSTSGGTFGTPSIVANTTFYCTAWNGTCESFVRTPVVARVNPTPTLTFAQSSPDVCGENAIVALTAGGDKQLSDLLYERFESGGLGAFTNINTDATPIGIKNDTKWTNRPSTFVPSVGLSWKPAISSGLAPNLYALATSDSGTPPDQLVENSITSGILNSTSYLNLTMTMKFYYSRYFPDNTNNADEFVTIDISTNGGAAWTPLQTFTADSGIGTKFVNLSYNLDAYINQTNLRVRIRHHSLGSVTGYLPDGVAIDDVRIFGDLPLNTAFVWSGASLPDVYSNPTATVPYVTGSPVVTVYVKPTIAQLEMGSYTFTATAVLSNGCTANQNITLLNKSKIWKGAVDNNWYNANNWSPIGIPDTNSCVIVPDIATSANRPSEINTAASNAYAKSLEVKSNGVLNIYPNNDLTITEAINVAATGLIDLENSASLIQINNVANTGNIRMKRNVNIRKQDYVYWSSPVAGFANSAVSPGTNLGYQYKWLPTTGGVNQFGNWTFANETMVLGKGYCLRAPDTYSLSSFTNFTATFLGVPNNGNITIPISRGIWNGGTYSTGVSTTPGTNEDDNWNLVGNPYPSAINALNFLTLNTNIAGFVNIWTHGTLPSNATADPFYNSYAYNYTPTDYLTFNAVGPSTGPGAGSFNGSLAAGQGFFVSMLHGTAATTENLIFNNSLRSNTNANDGFYKNSTNKDINNLEKHRIWFDLVSPNGNSVRSLLGYVENATNDKDRLFEAVSNEKLSFNIFSLVKDEKMLIQGRQLPFDSNDKVKIGISIPQDGLYKIALSSIDGLFLDTNQNIYLEDKLLNVIFNLKDAPYSFMSNKGTVKDRFVLRFAKEIEINEITNQLTVYDNNVLTVESGKSKIKNIQIFDILGKELFTKNNVNNTNYQINSLTRTNSLLIVKITLEDNTEEVRKVIY
ncbi:GEVED domain-containing protein [Flavobacterium facile]|uniref:GEVED domain-containing protein n=1 Tax=Flavobacterium facile TaxID=2893174 RepID=UPI002E7A3851|nr:GEVED domain-containing protein [Flavobacterium sp. T-12]